MTWPSPMQLIRQRRRPRRVYLGRPYWARAWFWWTGAFLFVLMFWFGVFSVWLVYAMVWGMLVWPMTAAQSRRRKGENW